jgi:uncharacterized cupin superfamily protein
VPTPNIYSPTFDDESDREGFSYRDSWLGAQAGAERLGGSLYEIEPGQATFPYHWHTANEELLLVLEGTVTLREPDGTREAAAGEVVAFPRGERGAHQLSNRGETTARFLVLSEMNWPDPCVYPDSGKVGVRLLPPGEGDARRRVFIEADSVDYWAGERPPQA